MPVTFKSMFPISVGRRLSQYISLVAGDVLQLSKPLPHLQQKSTEYLHFLEQRYYWYPVVVPELFDFMLFHYSYTTRVWTDMIDSWDMGPSYIVEFRWVRFYEMDQI